MKDSSKFLDLDWQLWFYWIIATTAGWLIGNLFFSALPVIIAGGVIAAGQWAILYKRLPKAWLWIPLSFLGWLIGNIISVLYLPDMWVGAFMGLTTGFTQWLYLKKKVYFAGWWIIISTIAWITGLTVLPGIFTSGALPGALTGLAMVILLDLAHKDETEQETE